MVSHDREFLNNVVTSTIVFEGNGRLQEYVGGYDDWLRQQQTAGGVARQSGVGQGGGSVPAAPGPVRGSGQTPPGGKKDKRPQEKQKLSYKEARELEGLPLTIEALEEEKQRLITTLNSPAFYLSAGRETAEIKKYSDRLENLEEELDDAYARWDELENLAAKLNGRTG
jgi:ATP-binding cassette subfamily F protein uup